MITKDNLKDYANKLMFEMDNHEYDTLLEEFEIILKQMDLIGKIDGISKVEPMTFPFSINPHPLRNDEICDKLAKEDLFKNVKEQENNQVKVPKVVG